MHDTPVVLGDVIERNARYFPGKTAVVFEGRRVTFSAFAARVRRVAMKDGKKRPVRLTAKQAPHRPATPPRRTVCEPRANVLS